MLDSLRGSDEIDDALVDPELKVVVSFGTVTAWGTPGCDPEPPAWHWDWATNVPPLLLQFLDKAVANLLEVPELGRGDGKADLASILLDGLLLLVTSNVGHIRKGQTDLLNLRQYRYGRIIIENLANLRMNLQGTQHWAPHPRSRSVKKTTKRPTQASKKRSVSPESPHTNTPAPSDKVPSSVRTSIDSPRASPKSKPQDRKTPQIPKSLSTPYQSISASSPRTEKGISDRQRPKTATSRSKQLVSSSLSKPEITLQPKPPQQNQFRDLWNLHKNNKLIYVVVTGCVVTSLYVSSDTTFTDLSKLAKLDPAITLTTRDNQKLTMSDTLFKAGVKDRIALRAIAKQ